MAEFAYQVTKVLGEGPATPHGGTVYELVDRNSGGITTVEAYADGRYPATVFVGQDERDRLTAEPPVEAAAMHVALGAAANYFAIAGANAR